MKLLLLLFIINGGVSAATIEAMGTGGKASYRGSITNAPSAVYFGASCYGNAAVTANMTLYKVDHTVSNSRTMSCGSASPLATATTLTGFIVDAELMNTSTSPVEITIAKGIMNSSTAWGTEKVTVPGKSVCTMNYNSVVDLGNIYAGESFAQKNLLTKGNGTGKIVIKPTSTDSDGAFINSSEGDKIHLNVTDSSGADSWDNSLKSWSGSNGNDYFIDAKTQAKKPGVYSGTMNVTISCD